MTSPQGLVKTVLFSHLGHSVIAVERHPIIYTLLADAVERAQKDTTDLDITTVHSDAESFLQHNPPADIVYLDPMFPEQRKSRLVKKPMQLLQAIAGPCTEDYHALLSYARQCANNKVIVKRSKNAPHIGNMAPNRIISYNQSTRYDIYD